MKKKLLILTERFYPEEFLINDLAAVVKESFVTEVLTQTPSYPHDKIFSGYTNKFFQTTNEYQDIPVHRVKTYCGYNKSVCIKIFNYLNFALLTSLWVLWHGRKYDRVFIYHTGPLTMATAGCILHFILRKKCVIWTQDLWPDSVYAYGFKPTWWKSILLNNFVKLIYSSCDIITVSSPGFIEKLGLYSTKRVLFIPQWNTIASPAAIEKKQDERTKIFTFAGNIGSVQNLDTLIEVFGKLKLKNCILQLVGGGVFLEQLKKYVKENKIDNIRFTGRLPQSDMPKIFAESDIMIISLKAEFSMTLPAKFQAYIAAGKPILAFTGGDTAALVKKYDLGYAAPPEKSDIEKAFTYLSEVSFVQIKQWGKNAAKLSESQFNRLAIISQFVDILK